VPPDTIPEPTPEPDADAGESVDTGPFDILYLTPDTTAAPPQERARAVVETTTTSTSAPYAEVLGEVLVREDPPKTTPKATPKRRVQPAPNSPILETPEFVTNLPRPDDISWTAKNVTNNAWIAFLLVLLLGLPAEIFNSSLKARQQNRPPHKRRGLLHTLETRINGLPNSILLVGFALVSALIYAELDPHLGFNSRSALLVGALTAALIIVTGVCEAARIPYLLKRHRARAHLQMFPRAFLVAIPLVVLSRVTGFHPGFIFGVTCALAVEGSLRDEHEGSSLALALVSVLALGVGAWFAWIPVSHAARLDEPSNVAILLDTFLATLWVTALQVVLFGMLPLKYLYGEKVMQWNRFGWFAIYFTAMFLFTQVLLHPESDAWAGFSENTLHLVAALGVVLLAASVAYWLWVRIRLRQLAAKGALVSLS
jgi:hypothetical protein